MPPSDSMANAASTAVAVLIVLLIVTIGAWGVFGGGSPAGTKKGIAYAEVRPQLRTFDVIAFRGKGPISSLIGQAEILGAFGGASDSYTHVGTVARGEDFPPESQLCVPGAVYLFESTLGGWLGDHVPSVDGSAYGGVQLRDLDTVVAMYDGAKGTSLDWIPLRSEYRPANVAGAWAQTWERSRYSRIGAMGRGLYRVRHALALGPAFLRSRPYFLQTCAEVTANVLRDLKLLPATFRPARAVPADWSQKGGRLQALYRPAVLFTTRPGG